MSLAQKIAIAFFSLVLPLTMLARWHEHTPAWSPLLGLPLVLWCFLCGIANACAHRLMLGADARWPLLLVSFALGAITPPLFEWWLSWRNVVLHVELIGLLFVVFLGPILVYAMVADRKSTRKAMNKDLPGSTSAHGARIE